VELHRRSPGQGREVGVVGNNGLRGLNERPWGRAMRVQKQLAGCGGEQWAGCGYVQRRSTRGVPCRPPLSILSAKPTSEHLLLRHYTSHQGSHPL